MLGKHLQPRWIGIRQALEQMQAGEHTQALAAMQQLPAELTSKSEVKLAITKWH